MKTFKQLLFLFTTAIILAGCGAQNTPVTQNVSTQNTPLENPRSCTIDSDCAIRNTYCEGCGQNYTCLNKSIESCKYNNTDGIQCEMPSPPWVTNCKCIKSQCVDCRGDECKTD